MTRGARRIGIEPGRRAGEGVGVDRPGEDIVEIGDDEMVVAGILAAGDFVEAGVAGEGDAFGPLCQPSFQRAEVDHPAASSVGQPAFQDRARVVLAVADHEQEGRGAIRRCELLEVLQHARQVRGAVPRHAGEDGASTHPLHRS